MVSANDPLQLLPMEKWESLEAVFKADWPRGISALTALKTQRALMEKGLYYGFEVYCPYGDVSCGMVALNKKPNFYEVWIQCPTDDTSQLENAILSKNVIDWSKEITVPCLAQHVFEVLLRVTQKLSLVCQKDMYPPLDMVIYEKTKPVFKNICLPEGIRFGPVLEKDIDLVDSTWVIRYDGSKWLFDLLVNAKQSYGLYMYDQLVSWVFINEVGILAHLYTPDKYRKVGYATLLLKLLCNKYLEEKRDLFGFCIRGNETALRLYESIGFEKLHYIRHTPVIPKQFASHVYNKKPLSD